MPFFLEFNFKLISPIRIFCNLWSLVWVFFLSRIPSACPCISIPSSCGHLKYALPGRAGESKPEILHMMSIPIPFLMYLVYFWGFTINSSLTWLLLGHSYSLSSCLTQFSVANKTSPVTCKRGSEGLRGTFFPEQKKDLGNPAPPEKPQVHWQTSPLRGQPLFL